MTVRAGTFSLEINGCDAELRLAGFRGEEGISQLYRFEIDFLTPGTHLNPESTVGSPVHLHIGVGDDRRVVHGVVISLSHGPITKDWARQQLVLGPPMRRLELRHDCRIFQEMTVSEVITEVFKSANMTVIKHINLKKLNPGLMNLYREKSSRDLIFVFMKAINNLSPSAANTQLFQKATGDTIGI